MVYELIKTSRFKAGVKLARKRGLDISLLEEVIEKLRLDQPLEARLRNHELTGNFKGVWECHIQPDWLLLCLKKIFPTANHKSACSHYASHAY